MQRQQVAIKAAPVHAGAHSPLNTAALTASAPAQRMNLILSVCSLSVVLLLHLAAARPAAELQSLKQLLEEDLLALPGSEELLGADDADSLKVAFGALRTNPWKEADPSNSVLATKENALVLLLKDLARTSKRSWSRYKKGGLRGCFGVRLERIGSFSGLGC